MIKNGQAPSPEAFLAVLQFMAPSQSEQPTCEEPYLDVDMEYQTWNIKWNQIYPLVNKHRP